MEQGFQQKDTARKRLLEDYIDRDGLAREWKCSPRTIARYEDMANGLPSVLLGGRKLYHVPTVMAWLESRMTRRNPSRHRRAA